MKIIIEQLQGDYKLHKLEFSYQAEKEVLFDRPNGAGIRGVTYKDVVMVTFTNGTEIPFMFCSLKDLKVAIKTLEYEARLVNK